MNLKDFGYNDWLQSILNENGINVDEIGRVITEHKERYNIITNKGELEAEITGNLRYSSNSREDFPAVGDWVVFVPMDTNSAVIQKVLPRYSMLSRQAVGQLGEIQILATNVDYALLIQAVDRDFNLNRLERYLTICYAAKVQPIIVLTKTDLISEEQVQLLCNNIKERIHDVPVKAISNITQGGFQELKNIIKKGKTYCMLGSSGVGKSSLLNNLSGESVMKTDHISEHTNKGRHVTTHRELILLENGAILIDNPGMREVGMTDATQGLESVFDNILRLAENCKYSDCTHTNENGCAVVEAVENGELDNKVYTNFQKLEKEKQHFESSVAERRKKDKDFGKMVKTFKKIKKK